MVLIVLKIMFHVMFEIDVVDSTMLNVVEC